MNVFGTLNSLEPLINSEGGIHFSAYISSHHGAPNAKLQLQEALKVISEDTRFVLSRKDRQELIKPIENLLTDKSFTKPQKGSLGIFRSQNFFKVITIPIHTEEYSTVATSFHVKPILKWIQQDRSFYILTLDKRVCRLYSGTQNLFRHIDSYIKPKSLKFRSLGSLKSIWSGETQTHKIKAQEETLKWLNKILNQNQVYFCPPLFVIGAENEQKFIKNNLNYFDIRTITKSQAPDLVSCLSLARSMVQKEIEQITNHKINLFKTADALDLTETNIFKIAKAANRGLIKKLLVASDKKIFGKISSKLGTLQIHAADIDHEDDDILDDIAQKVIKSGGEVTLTPSKKIPQNVPLLAIIDPRDPTTSPQNNKLLADDNIWQLGVIYNYMNGGNQIGVKT